MQPNRLSQTAIGIASVRAHHHENDDPLVFDDPYAVKLLDEADRTRALDQAFALASEVDRVRAQAIEDRAEREAALMRAIPFTGSALVTFRVADDWLRKALDEGIEQCVVLGAGLDSTSLRLADHLGPLRILEVDHPATQRHKRQRMAARGLSPHPNTEFVAVDFHTDSLAARLSASSYQRDRPAFFSWLNVIYYLNDEAALDTFETIYRAAAPGSALVFDIYETRVERRATEREADLRMKSLVSALGEPPASELSAESLLGELRAMGFVEVDAVRPEEAEPWHRTARCLGYGFMSGCWIVRARR